MSAADIESMWRLLLALGCGTCLGLNRDLHHKPAGVRTFSLVSVGAALVTLAAAHLSTTDAGTVGRVCELTGDAQFCQRVREMGFGESAYVTKVSGSTTILCQVNGTRIALSHAAASSIIVEQLGNLGPQKG